MNPTCSSPPCATSLRGDIGCTTVAGTTEYNHERLSKGDTIAAGSHIYGPFEAGFTSRQDDIISGWGCSDPSQAYDTTGGKDVGIASQITAYKCGITLPRIEGDNYYGIVGACGGHTHDYHFHGSFSCLYNTENGGHSAEVGESAGHKIYGKWEDRDEGLLPLLDACGGHYGPTPDGDWVYHYHVQDTAPFTVGCHGPAADGGLVSLSTCRSLYATCGDGTDTLTVGAGMTVEYDRDCPCFDANGSNVGTQELRALQTSDIAYYEGTGQGFSTGATGGAGGSDDDSSAPTEARVAQDGVPTIISVEYAAVMFCIASMALAY